MYYTSSPPTLLFKMKILDYTLMYQIREETKEEYEKYKCDPRKYNIGYCKDVKGENCPNTCEYAVGIEKKLK